MTTFYGFIKNTNTKKITSGARIPCPVQQPTGECSGSRGKAVPIRPIRDPLISCPAAGMLSLPRRTAAVRLPSGAPDETVPVRNRDSWPNARYHLPGRAVFPTIQRLQRPAQLLEKLPFIRRGGG